jgi:hypothetical protein
MSFLDTWTPEKAWWWGILLGDGNVYSSRGDNRVSVCGSASTVRRWLDLIAPWKEPKEFTRSPGTFQGYVHSKELVAWFKERGICGRKCETIVWPDDLPEALISHFLRGLWDSDGSLSIWDRRAHGKKGNPEAKASFGCMSRTLVEQVRVALVLAEAPLVAITPSAKMYKVSYGGTSAMRVADYLYVDAPEHLRNDDRVEVYQRMCALRDQLADAACACGRPVTREGKCQACWWEARGRTTGVGTACACGKSPVRGRGMCSACYSRAYRTVRAYELALFDQK